MNNLIYFQNDSILTQYLNYVYSIPTLTLEEEQLLIAQWTSNTDVNAAHKLVLAHLRLVVKIATTFKSYELSILDLISEGNIGLMKAVKKFNHHMKCRLSTYASWWIKANIQEYILKSWTMVKVSTTAMKRKLFYKLKDLKDKINIETLNDYKVSSLDEEIYENTCIGDLIIANDKSSEDIIMEKEEKIHMIKLLQKAIDTLSEREKNILYARKLHKYPSTLKELSDRYQLSMERIRQIEETIIKKLKKFLT